ncbi:MAG: TIGR01459 family HAD-type hydrolase [Filomicrobium sp.]
MTNHELPPILTGAADLLMQYDVLFCDVWGVVHDGHWALPDAADALTRFRNNGGTVILVSNAPVPNHQVANMLDERRLPREAWDDIVSSGDLALEHITDQHFKTLFPIGPQDRDAALFDEVRTLTESLSEADAILCSGLNDDINETAETYRPLLDAAHAQGTPFVCANPDLVVDVGGTLYLCAGAIADLYEQIGGKVFWAGKPFRIAYEAAHNKAQNLRQATVTTSKILVVGDSVRTDLKGAQNFEVDALFIAGGIHREEVMHGATIAPDRLGEVLKPGTPPAVAAMPHLAW